MCSLLFENQQKKKKKNTPPHPPKKKPRKNLYPYLYTSKEKWLVLIMLY